MLYISIVLILCGVIVLIYSISIELKKYRVPGDIETGKPLDYPDDFQGNGQRPERIEAVPLRGVSNYHDLAHGSLDEDRGGRVELRSDSPQAKQDRGAGDRADAMESPAVFFEDSSNLIDYTMATGTIDPGLEEYKKIVRIGKGMLRYEKHGISFNMENRFYRFDFHRLENLSAGDNYIALAMKGGQPKKLFILEANTGLIPAISGYYKSYSRK